MIKRTKRERSFTVLGNVIFKESQLSWQAMGMLSYLLSKPDNWTVLPKALVKATDGTKKKTAINGVYSILKELRDVGFVEMKKNSSGTVDYYVYDEPDHHNNSQAKKPDHHNPDEANPDEGYDSTYKEHDIKKRTDKDNKYKESNKESETNGKKCPSITSPEKTPKDIKVNIAKGVKLGNNKSTSLTNGQVKTDVFYNEFKSIYEKFEVYPSNFYWELATDEFEDYWFGISHLAKGKKTDWLATWRNWIRRDLKSNAWKYKKEQDNQASSEKQKPKYTKEELAMDIDEYAHHISEKQKHMNENILEMTE